jgi:hypothetical protein
MGHLRCNLDKGIVQPKRLMSVYAENINLIIALENLDDGQDSLLVDGIEYARRIMSVLLDQLSSILA